jgi:hypothetical protein
LQEQLRVSEQEILASIQELQRQLLELKRQEQEAEMHILEEGGNSDMRVCIYGICIYS